MPRRLEKVTLSAGVAHLSVGHQETPFDVHLELLCDCSPFFNDLYKDRFDHDVTQQPVCFPDEDPDVFAELVNWMYQGELSDNMIYHKSHFLFQLWVLAEKFAMQELQDSILSLCEKRIDRLKGNTYGINTIDYVYGHTLPGSPLRRFVIDTWVRTATKPQFMDRKEKLPRAFLEDLCCAYIVKKENQEETGPGSPERDSSHSPLAPSNRALLNWNIPEIATPDQMKNRKIKRPSSRLRGSSPASSASVMTPSYTEADGDLNRDVTQDIRHWRI
ncbi:hypothetical protein PHISCL_02111 [Aspergillus sclerotialis]|uniref:BTB domain-containing protein n=1 Tax=Aspergillus sclerotialis TaxID=2070753 RepID=A0A3A3A874_9EURO|nr:hypothetical protein PHISCL_02111 [Aspergillus sclerotialis]